MASMLNKAKRKATNTDDADQRHVRQRQERMRAHDLDLREAGRRNLSPLPNGDSNVVPQPLNLSGQNKELHSNLWFQSKAGSSHLDESNGPISPVSDTTMNDHDDSVARLMQKSKSSLFVDRNPAGSSTLGYRSSAAPVNHKYYFGDKIAEVTYGKYHFKLEIGSHQSLKRSGADHSSTLTQHVYQIEDIKIGVESDGQKLTMTTSANQQTVLNADTVLSSSADQSLQSTINQNGQQERSLFCHGSIFEIKDQLESESVYCHLAIVNQHEFRDHIGKEVEIEDERYMHLDLDRTPGVHYAQEIGNLFYLIRKHEGVELDAVLDKRIMDKNQHTIPIMLNVYGRKTDHHKIKGIFERYNTTLFKPIHVPVKFGLGVLCSEDRGKEFFYCRQLCLLAVWNYESITKQNEWKDGWNQTAWQKNEWDDLEAKVNELTKGAVQFPQVIDVSKDWGSSLLKF